MKWKRKSNILCLLCIVLLTSVFGNALASQPMTIEYIGGVIERGNHYSRIAAFSLADELDVAYVRLEKGELIVGEESIWHVAADGGLAPYSYEYALFHKDFSDPSNIFTYVGGSGAALEEAFFSLEIPKEGWYILQFVINDANGDYVVFQSPRFATSTHELQQIVDEIVSTYVNANMSDYEKALVLHDYLCETASYDESLTIHEPSGVLLQKTGVCESFALAYQMLLSKADVENVYVEGYGGGTAHAWNMIRLEDDWYHVDVTWDEARTDRYYFGMNDTLIERSHVITSRVPAAEGIKYNTALNQSDGAFSSLNELFDLFAILPENQESFQFYYLGEERIASSFFEWCEKNWADLGIYSYGFEDNPQHTMYVHGTIEPKESGKAIKAEAFSGLSVQVVIVPEGCIAINDMVYAHCTELKEIHIPESVLSIADNAFYNCPQLTIYAPKGSAAALYAKEKGIPWVAE